ncbi:16735_t:CDS:1 [Rhizophagus irregularis]|nr:hypothetical protein RirG_123810 [Rhizophagus irregularis DAOM 197198w]CAG8712344.1 16735_t:CDS:1 [Rhizophagus irregularis]
MDKYYDCFEEIYDKYLIDVVKRKNLWNIKKILGPNALFTPEKMLVRLDKRETLVPKLYYFITIFLTKLSSEVVSSIVKDLLQREKTAAEKNNEPIIIQSKADKIKIAEISKENDGLKGIVDLENRIWNLEADVTAKERIILEKTEENNLIWGKTEGAREKRG